jgi:hypothetical protein
MGVLQRARTRGSFGSFVGFGCKMISAVVDSSDILVRRTVPGGPAVSICRALSCCSIVAEESSMDGMVDANVYSM